MCMLVYYYGGVYSDYVSIYVYYMYVCTSVLYADDSSNKSKKAGGAKGDSKLSVSLS